jgi:hypothetical protein
MRTPTKLICVPGGLRRRRQNRGIFRSSKPERRAKKNCVNDDVGLMHSKRSILEMCPEFSKSARISIFFSVSVSTLSDENRFLQHVLHFGASHGSANRCIGMQAGGLPVLWQYKWCNIESQRKKVPTRTDLVSAQMNFRVSVANFGAANLRTSIPNKAD